MPRVNVSERKVEKHLCKNLLCCDQRERKKIDPYVRAATFFVVKCVCRVRPWIEMKPWCYPWYRIHSPYNEFNSTYIESIEVFLPKSRVLYSPSAENIASPESSLERQSLQHMLTESISVKYSRTVWLDKTLLPPGKRIPNTRKKKTTKMPFWNEMMCCKKVKLWKKTMQLKI